jgi:hypothetical protein
MIRANGKPVIIYPAPEFCSLINENVYYKWKLFLNGTADTWGFLN